MGRTATVEANLDGRKKRPNCRDGIHERVFLECINRTYLDRRVALLASLSALSSNCFSSTCLRSLGSMTARSIWKMEERFSIDGLLKSVNHLTATGKPRCLPRIITRIKTTLDKGRIAPTSLRHRNNQQCISVVRRYHIREIVISYS